ncbi:hypothetical protein QBZ16_001885 [Prototheca wickerhamii]|uniref:TFIIS N-terminal domain-containing protein n=1 Tax=Prototheca wickerhamii TaxID=3111 RepID=A0AAD9IJC6_PROWI|nr:hypothetical protein QBZ16_001885 [Prototheca wickerhamii]
MRGTDQRASGHYTYAKVPEFDAPPLNCTNRVKVVSWLGRQGITSQVPETSCTLPALSLDWLARSAQGDALPNPGPGAALCPPCWLECREETVFISGQSCQQFHLIDSSGGRTLAATSCPGLVAPTAAAASPSAVSLGQPPRGCHHDEAATHGGHRSFQVQALPRPPFGGAKLRPWGALPAGTAADELLAEDSPLLASPFSPIALIHTGMEEQASFLSDPALSHQSYSVTQMSACFSDASLPGTPAGAAPPACANAAAVSRHVPPSHLVHWAQLLSGAGQPRHRAGALETGYVAPPEVALPVLSELLQSGVDLVILETTQLSKVVAELRQHPVPAVADLAGRVVARWRDIALQVLQRDA